MGTRLTFTALVLAVSLTNSALAVERHVPSQYATIQAAIDAAVAGDEVIIANGTYTGAGNRNLDFLGKAITVRSASGDPNTCIIDCEAAGRGFYFQWEEGPDSILADVTVANGKAVEGIGIPGADDRGAGIYCIQDSNPTISNCIIRNCEADTGAGVCCDIGASPVFEHCVVHDNVANVQAGGVYCATSSAPTFTDCTISFNSSIGPVGGILLSESSPSIQLNNCLINNNSALYGGGMYLFNASPTIFGCVFADNSATDVDAGDGAGLLCYDSSPALTDCSFTGNVATGGGGAIFVYKDIGAADPSFTGCTISGNQSLGQSHPQLFFDGGGGLHLVGGTVTMSGCTIWGNTARAGGGGLYLAGEASLTNCQVTENTCEAHGGGISLDNTSAVISNCHIHDNTSEGNGGGVYALAEAPTLDACSIAGNSATGDGGGVSLFWSQATVTGCTIDANEAAEGGGIAIGETLPWESPTVDDCVVAANIADNGGGIALRDATATVSRCDVSANESQSYGGGFFSHDSSPILDRCSVSENTALSGAGVYCDGVSCSAGSDPVLVNCKIRDNKAVAFGGGICCVNTSALVGSSTLYGNMASEGGGAWFNGGASCSRDVIYPSVVNTVVWNNGGDSVYVSPGSSVTVTYSDVEDGSGQPWFGMGCLDVEPLFAFAEDCHLVAGSPCIDAGTNTPPGGLPGDDVDGTPRPLDGDGDALAVADMGAYEFDPATPAIALSADQIAFFAVLGGDEPASQTLSLRNAGGGTLNWNIAGGEAWLTITPRSGESVEEVDTSVFEVHTAVLPYGIHTASLDVVDPAAVNSPREVSVTVYVAGTLEVPTQFATIQDALDAAIPGDAIELAAGTYTGAGNRDLDAHGKPIIVRSATGDATTCVIDCEGAGRGFHFYNGETASTIIEGLTIRNGSAARGGAVYCKNESSPLIVNCILEQCVATGNAMDGGGALYSSYSNPHLVGCTLQDNEAIAEGGAVYLYGGAPRLVGCSITANTASFAGGISIQPETVATLEQCVIDQNTATTFGGILFRAGCAAAVQRCAVRGNVSTSSGGGLGFFGPSSSRVVNCVIESNQASTAGGGIHCAGSAPLLVNCRITSNTAATDGGGVACYGAPAPEFVNCVISDNEGAAQGGGIAALSGSQPSVTNSIVWYNSSGNVYVETGGDATVTYSDIEGGTGQPWLGVGCIDVDPLFQTEGGYRLHANSPCIDAGDNTAVPADTEDLDNDGDVAEPVPVDLDLRIRFYDDPGTPDSGFGTPPIVDMGAYEYGAPWVVGDLDGDGDVDTDDFILFVDCMPGPDILTAPPGCDPDVFEAADLQGDGDVDVADFAEFQTVFGT